MTNSAHHPDQGREPLSSLHTFLTTLINRYPDEESAAEAGNVLIELSDLLAPDADPQELEPWVISRDLQQDGEILFREEVARTLLRRGDHVYRCTVRHGDEGWRLKAFEMWCPVCLGSGLLEDVLCEVCFGNGWGSHGSTSSTGA